MAVLGAGGGTSSYEEIETAEFVALWGSNAREAHPIFFHHVMKGVRNGAKMYVIDPRRTASAQWADTWMGLRIGSDIALANAVGREIIAQGLHNREFVAHSTSGFESYAETVDRYTLAYAEEITGIPKSAIQQFAVDYATAKTAQICWVLGITEHHNGTDNVLSLIDLALLTGHVGRYGSGLVPIRGQNNVQGGGDMGGLPNKYPGYQDIEDPVSQAKFEAAWGVALNPKKGKHISLVFDAMEEGVVRGLYVLGENPAQSEADADRIRRLLTNLDFMVVQDIFLTKTGEMADVVFPAAVGWAESEGTFTNSERRVQRVRQAVRAPGEAKHDHEIVAMLANAMGAGWGVPSANEVWEELRSLSPMHTGMTYERLEELDGIQWPCPTMDHPGTKFLHSWLWEDPMPREPAPFKPVEYSPPIDPLSEEFPIRLTTGRHLDSYNTGVQSGGYSSPMRRGGVIDLAPSSARDLGVKEGETVRISSRRASIDVPVRFDRDLRPGLAFMTTHNPDEADVNRLTIDAWDPQAGTAEFKATAIRVEKISV